MGSQTGSLAEPSHQHRQINRPEATQAHHLDTTSDNRQAVTTQRLKAANQREGSVGGRQKRASKKVVPDLFAEITWALFYSLLGQAGVAGSPRF